PRPTLFPYTTLFRSLAGGLTDYGQKERVKVIREVDGRREVGIVDLSDEKLFESPYYNLMQNDVVMVDPVKTKQKKAEQDTVIQRDRKSTRLNSSHVK